MGEVASNALKEGVIYPVECVLREGRLLPALGGKKTANTVPADITRAFYNKTGGFYCAFSKSGLWVSLNGTRFVSASGKPSDGAFLIEDTFGGVAKALAVYGTECCELKDGSFMQKSFAGNITGGTMKSGRLFGVSLSDPLKICWSGEGGTDDWQEGISGAGWARVSPGLGNVLALFNAGERIAAVRERGITFMKAGGTPENYSFTGDIPTPPIAAGTCAMVGERLFFFAGEGLYCLENSSVKPVGSRIFADVSSPDGCSVRDDRYYVLAGVSKKLGRRVMWQYDCESGETYAIDAPARALACGERLFAYCADGSSYELEEASSPSCYIGGLDFGSAKRKVLTRIEVECDGEVEAEISNGSISRKVTVKGAKQVHMRGVKFSLKLSFGKAVRSVKAYAEV